MAKIFEMSFAIMILLSASSCNANPKQVQSLKTGNTDSLLFNKQERQSFKGEDTTKIDSIIDDKVAALPEFRKLLKYNDKYGNVSISIIKRPQVDFKYYWVQVGRDHPERFEPIYNFYISPENLELFYYDPDADTTLTLKQWREKR